MAKIGSLANTMRSNKIGYITGQIFVIVAAIFGFSMRISARGVVAKDRYSVSPPVPVFLRQLTELEPGRRVDVASEYYRRHFRRSDSVVAKSWFVRLDDLARTLDDQRLACAVFDFRADYYSVHLGLNPFSAALYQHAADMARGYGLSFETGGYLHKKARYFQVFRQNTSACLYYLQAMAIFREIGFSKVPGIGSYLADVADFYYNIGDYDNSKEFLLLALRYGGPTLRATINMTNTIGLIYRGRKQYALALYYFRKAHTMAVNGRDTVWVGITDGNTGSVYFLRKEYDKAIHFLESDVRICLRFNENKNAAIALLRLARIAFDRNDFTVTDRYIKQAALLIERARNTLAVRLDLALLQAELAERKGSSDKALYHWKQYVKWKDSLVMLHNVAAVERVKLRWESEKYEKRVAQLNRDAQIESLKRRVIVVVLVVLGLIGLRLYRRQRRFAGEERAMLLSEKSALDDELKTAASTLDEYTRHLKEKNALIEEFKAELERLKDHSLSPRDGQLTADLELLMQAQIMTDYQWNEFRRLFQKVHAGFFGHIKTNFPRFTETDTRLLCLIKLGLNNREMANMLGITVEGVKKAKQRLRKKMELPLGETIEAALLRW